MNNFKKLLTSFLNRDHNRKEQILIPEDLSNSEIAVATEEYDNLRRFLFMSFSSKELTRIIETHSFLSIVFAKIPTTERKYQTKEQTVNLLISILKDQDWGLKDFMLNVQSLKPQDFEKYKPFPYNNLDTSIQADSQIKTQCADEPNLDNHLKGKDEELDYENNTKIINQRQKGKTEYQEKLYRRQIRDEFFAFQAKGEQCDEREIIDFFLKYGADSRNLGLALEQWKNDKGKPARLIWRLISNENDVAQSPEFLERKLLQDTRAHIQKSLPDVIHETMSITENGPKPFSQQRIQRLISNWVDEGDFTVDGRFPLRMPGEHRVTIHFKVGFQIDQRLSLELKQAPLPVDVLDGLKSFQPLLIDDAEDVLQYLQVYLAGTSPDTLEDYFPRLSSVLFTAYQLGYWKAPLIQDLFKDWQTRRQEYNQRVRIQKMREIFEKNIQLQGLLIIPREKDTDNLDGIQIVNLAREILTQHDLVSPDLKLEFIGTADQSVLPIEVSIDHNLLGIIYLRRRTYSISAQGKNIKEPIENEITSNALLGLHKSLISDDQLLSEKKKKVFRAATQRVINDFQNIIYEDVTIPGNYISLLTDVKTFSNRPFNERSSHFLKLSKAYLDSGKPNMLRFVLCHYCFSKAQELFRSNRRDSRAYLLVFLFYYGQVSPEQQKEVAYEYIDALDKYFNTYNIRINTHGKFPQARDIFYKNLDRALLSMGRRRNELLGNCLCEIAIVNSPFIFDLINRLNTRQNTDRQKMVIVKSLQEPLVFRSAPFLCMQMLERISPGSCGTALSRLSLNTLEERRLTAIAFIQYMVNMDGIAENILRYFSASASMDTKVTFAFSLLIEPFISNPQQEEENRKEGRVKAELIVEAFGLPKGIPATEFFQGVIIELANLFNKFARTHDPNIKAGYHTYILDKTRKNKKYFVRHYRTELGDLISQLFRRVDAHATSEQSKLIQDTSLEITLVTERALYSPKETRFTIEIRNVGEGIADGLELRVFPVADQYDVEERYSVYSIDVLADKNPVQIDRFICPKVGDKDTVELLVELKYDTLEVKDKIIYLAPNNRKIQFYPETQFVRISKPYSIGGPATTWFYGRHHLLEMMADNLPLRSGQGTSMIVYGLKRTGKTSVVKRLISHTLVDRNLNTEYLPIYHDLAMSPKTAFSSDECFLHNLKKIIMDNLPSNLCTTLNKSYKEEPDRDYEDFVSFQKFWDAAIKTIGSRRLLLVLDEFSLLNAHITLFKGKEGLSPQLFTYLSNLIQSTDQLVFIFTGTYVLYEMMRQKAQDIAKICYPYLVCYLDEESTRRLIQEPVTDNLSGSGLYYEPRVVDRLVKVTACHPYLIQLICSYLVDRMNNLKYNIVNLSDIDAVLEDLVNIPAQSQNISAILWDELDQPQRRLLSVIAAKGNQENPWVDLDEILETLKELQPYTLMEDLLKTCSKLEDAELIDKVTADDSTTFKIKIPIHETWLRRTKNLQEVISR